MLPHKRGLSILFMGLLMVGLFLGISREVLYGLGDDDGAVIRQAPSGSYPSTTAGDPKQECDYLLKAALGECVKYAHPAGISPIQGGTVISPSEGMTITLPIILKNPAGIPPEEVASEQAIARQINEQRALNGLSELVLVADLTESARKHSRDMADNHYTSHAGSDGSNPGQRIAEAGYDASAWGEIIAWGFGGDTSWVVEWWMNSPVHRSIILSSTFTDFGVGYTRDPASDWGHYWTVNFGLPRSSNDFALDRGLHECNFLFSGRFGGSSLMVYSVDFCP